MRHEDEHEQLEIRNIGFLGTIMGEDNIAIDHVFSMNNRECPECGGESEDEGFVGLMINDDESDNHASILLTAEEALLLANRLQRAAEVVLESDEDLPNPEREYRRRVKAGGPE